MTRKLSKSAMTAMLVAGGLVAALPGITPARAQCGSTKAPCGGYKSTSAPCSGKKAADKKK